MQAIADTSRLVEDGVITSEQAKTIEARARETMVYLAINFILCLGIIAATGGLINWLGTPALVAVSGLALVGMGFLILVNGGELYRMFGNASALIGGGMVIGGASLELMQKHSGIAGTAMTAFGFIVAAAAAQLLKAERSQTRFVTGAIGLMGLAMHLVGIAFLMDQQGTSGALISASYLYATALIVAAGWWTDVRLVTALAIVPFAQALDTSIFYYRAPYVLYPEEPTLSIIQMTLLLSGCLWLAAHRPERMARHLHVLAVMAFIVANVNALTGSLLGDFVGETIWGPTGPNSYSGVAWEEWKRANEAFRETALHLSEELYSVLWAAALAALILWSAHKAQRGLLNASVTFVGIHAYVQFLTRFYDEPLAYVIGGLVAIPLAWGMWRLDQWIVARRGFAGTS